MNQQHERIAALCEQLKLDRIGTEWPGLAQDAAKQEASFADFLEAALSSERSLRDERKRVTLTRLATMPAIKTLDQFDWNHASGAPKAQIQELAHLAFVHRATERGVAGSKRRGQDPHRLGARPSRGDGGDQNTVHRRSGLDVAVGHR